MFTQITNILNAFLLEHEFEETAKIDSNFFYLLPQDEIHFSLVVPQPAADNFINFALENGLKENVGNFLLAFFHELGHGETLDLLDDDDIAYSLGKKYVLSDSAADYQKYMRLPDEFAATSWAIDYINEHLEEIADLAEKLQKEFQKILDIMD